MSAKKLSIADQKRLSRATKENASTPNFFYRPGYDESNVTVKFILPVPVPVVGEDVEDVLDVTGLSVLRVFTARLLMRQKIKIKKLKLSVSENLIWDSKK